MKRVFHLSAGRGGTSRDVERELAFHLEMRTRELVASGRNEADARREARAAFSDVSAVRAACLTVQGKRTRERARTEFMHTLWQDLRVATRTLRRALVRDRGVGVPRAGASRHARGSHDRAA
ncbi:MAG TPA: permease prefix domain 1-containing protein [Gemmatimonadaceae bacterium]|nr:permease prefix domain 1-containing protein [Gemmatimonadaceae bacterium]